MPPCPGRDRGTRQGTPADGLMRAPSTRGHWRRGRRRHTEQTDIIGLLRDVIAMGVSVRRCAAWLGVSDRTLRRWLAGEDHPDPRTVARAIAASMSPAHPTGTGDWTRRVCRWAGWTVPHGGHAEHYTHGEYRTDT